MRFQKELCHPAESYDLYFKFSIAYETIASVRKHSRVKFVEEKEKYLRKDLQENYVVLFKSSKCL